MPQLRLGEAERHALACEASRLSVPLGDLALSRLVEFAELLGFWSEKTNLISCRSPRELVARHLLDSLAPAPLLREVTSVADLGSGAGFPGIPLAVANPRLRVLLVEARRRRANFLREVRRSLSLENVEVIEARAEDSRARPGGLRVDAVVSRAVWASDEILEVALPWLGEAGALLWMRSESSGSRVGSSAVSTGALSWERTVRYELPGSVARVIEVFRRSLPGPRSGA